MLSFDGWVNGFSSLFVLVFGVIFGIYLIKRSGEYRSKLVKYFGISSIFLGLAYSYWILDFFTILITGFNAPFNFVFPPGSSTYLLILLTTWMWIPLNIIATAFIGIELLFPSKKNYFKICVIILAILYEIFMFLDTKSYLIITPPPVLGDDLTDSSLVFGSPPSIIILIYALFNSSFFIIGLLIKGLQAEGLIRRNFILLSLSYSLFVANGVLEILMNPGILKISLRVIIILYLYLSYVALRPKKIRKHGKKAPTEEMIKLATYMLGKPSIKDIDNQDILKNLKIDKKLLIFMSYATKDVNFFKIHETANLLKEFPEIENVLFWEEHMEDNIFEYMDENLGKCDIFILFCSKNALDSVPVKKEWTAAEALEKPIIPIFYNPNYIPPLLSSRLGIEYDFYDMEQNVRDLHHLILKKYSGITD